MSSSRATGLNVCVLAMLILPSAMGCKSKEDQQREEAQRKYEEATQKMKEVTQQLAEQAAARGAVAAEGVANAEPAAAPGAKAPGAGAAMKNFAQAMQNMQEGMAGAAAVTGGVEPVNFRKLKALLPEEIAGLPRKSASGQKAGIVGMAVSEAKGRYDGADGKRITVKLIDAGGMKGAMMMGAFGMGMIEIDREDDNGYERLSTVGGNKVLEKWNSKTLRGEYKIVVAGRFIVDIDGRKVTMDDLKAAAKAIDISKLEGLGTASE